MKDQQFKELSEGFFVDADYAELFGDNNLDSMEVVFCFEGGRSLEKENLAAHRSRVEFRLGDCGTAFFLKRYDRPPVSVQIKNWVNHFKRASTSDYDRLPGRELRTAGINTPKVVAYGSQWGGIFERRSFIITEEIPTGQSLEKKLPGFFYEKWSPDNTRLRREFINRLADFVRSFHESGFRHRDLYLCHIFLTDDGQFYLLDLQRAFRPRIFSWRFRVKDIAQLYYSAPGKYFSDADRLRFYLRYSGRNKLGPLDRLFLRRVRAKAWRIADHDIRHGRSVPFAM